MSDLSPTAQKLTVAICSLFWLTVASCCFADEREIFSNAREAYKSRNVKALDAYSSQLHAKNYTLAAYTDYWQLLLNLDNTPSPVLQEFLSKHEDYPFDERLRSEWLKTLAKRKEWSTFFEEFPKLEKEDTAVSCYAALGRFERGEVGTLIEGRRLWLTGSDQPSTCDSLFNLLKDNGVLLDDDVWARLRLAFQANRVSVAKAATRYLDDPPDAARLKFYDKVYESPQRALEKKLISTGSRSGRELFMYAVERVSRSQPALAMDFWNAARQNFNRDEQAYMWGRLALSFARKHDPQTLDLFKKADKTPLDAEQLAWKVRACLRERNWDELLLSIASMPQKQQEESAWRYWKGRAFKEKGNITAANAQFVSLSKERSFYGVLAEEEMGEAMGAPLAAYRASESDVAAVQRVPGIQRAIEFFEMDQRWDAKSEWLQASRNFDDRQLIAAAELAFRQEWYDVAINTADKTALTHDFNLRYPTPYREMMDNYVLDNQLDEAWVYGLIRQESRFVSFARSGVGAAGLMQVMPATAKWVAKRMGLADYHPGLINRVETNIQLGTYYMRHVLDEMNGQALMATAAYNAGPGRPKRWAGDKTMEGAIYAETIPFIETRDYVQKVMTNAYFYAHRLGQKLQTLKQRIGTVVGNASDSAVEDNIQAQE